MASRRGEESQNLAHDALSLIRLEQELCVRGAVDDDQLFRIGRLLVLRANLRKSWARVVGVVPRDDEQFPPLPFFGLAVGTGCQQYQAIDFTWRGSHGVERRIASHACSDDRHVLCAFLTQVSYSAHYSQGRPKTRSARFLSSFGLANPPTID